MRHGTAEEGWGSRSKAVALQVESSETRQREQTTHRGKRVPGKRQLCEGAEDAGC